MRNAIRLFLTSFRAGAAAVALVVLASTSYAQTITTIDPPNSTFTIAQAINPVGQIVGYYLDGSGIHGFLRQPSGAITSFNVSRDGFQLGTFATFGVIPEMGIESTQAQAINSTGQITGSYNAGNASVGFLRQPNGTIITFNPPGSSGTIATAINSTGQITGSYYDGSVSHGFLRQPGGSIITFDPAGSSNTQAKGINSTCQIAGYYLGADSTYHGFLRQPDGSITTFDAPGAGTGSNQGTFAQAINPAGKITGYYIAADNTYHGFVRSQ